MIAVYQRDPETFIVADSPDAPVGALLRGTHMGPVVPIDSLLKWGYWTPVPLELQAAGWDESRHPRHPRGTKVEGGRFAPSAGAPSQAWQEKDPGWIRSIGSWHEATKEDVLAGKVEGITTAELREGVAGHARDRDITVSPDSLAAFPDGKLGTYLLSHEAGHDIANEIQRGAGYATPWGDEYSPEYTNEPGEIIADTYAELLHGGLERAIEDGNIEKQALLERVAETARKVGAPAERMWRFERDPDTGDYATVLASGWDESKHPRDPGGEGGGRWVRAGDLGSDDFRPEEQTTDRNQLIDQFQQIQGMWDTESRGALEQYVQHEMTDEEYQSYSIQDEKAAVKGIVQDRIAAALEGDPDFLSLHKAVFESGGGTFEDWASEFEPGGEFPTANTPEKQVSAMMVSAWARSSSDTDPISLQLQEAAVEEFGLEGHTSFHVEALDEMKSLYEGSMHSPIWNDQQKAGARKFLRAQYDLSQEMFRRHGISEVTLYRGMSWGPADYEKAGRPVALGTPGEMTRVRTNPMSSYSYSFDTAVGFAGKYDISAVLGTKVDVKRVLSTPFTGAGCLTEGEFVVIGGDDTDGFVVSWANKRMNYDTGEVEEAVGMRPATADIFDDRWMDTAENVQTTRQLNAEEIEVKDA